MGFILNPFTGQLDKVNASGGGGGSGTVTSVGLDLPSIFNVTVSPITTSGDLTATLVDQNANLVLAGPTSGAAGTPTFRALVPLDIPTLTSAKISDFQATVSLNTDVAANTAVRHDAVTLGISNGLSIFGQQLSLDTASATTTGALTDIDWIRFDAAATATRVKLETHTLTGTDITNGYVTLTNTPVTAGLTQLDVVTGGPQAYGIDFTIVSGNRLSWSGLLLDGILSNGDILNIIIS